MSDRPRKTLSQKKINESKAPAPASKLAKERIEELSLKEEEQSSIKKAVIWIVVVILLAVAAYIGLKSLLKDEMEESSEQQQSAEEVSPTPTTLVEENVDNEEEDIEVTPTTSATPIPTTVEKVTKPTEASVENDFGIKNQSIPSTVNGNKVVITRYNYFDTSDLFTFNLVLDGGVPEVVATQDGAKIRLNIKNISSDNILDGGKETEVDFAATGSANQSKLLIKELDNTSEYTFEAKNKADYKLEYIEADSTLRLLIEN